MPKWSQDKRDPFKPIYLNCKRCMKQYRLDIPYKEANHPARDLCDDCIIDMSPEEYKTFGLTIIAGAPLETKGGVSTYLTSFNNSLD
jgi:hypothetical protein